MIANLRQQIETLQVDNDEDHAEGEDHDDDDVDSDDAVDDEE